MTIDNETIRDIAGVPDPQALVADEAESTEEAVVEEQETEAQLETDESVDTETDESDVSEDEEEKEEVQRHLINFRRNEEDHEFELKYGEDGKLDGDVVEQVRTMLEKEGLEVTAQRAIEGRKDAERQLEAERTKLDTLNTDLSKAELGAKRWKELNESPQALQGYNRYRQQSRQAPIDPAKDKLEAEVATQKRQLEKAEYDQILRQASDFSNSVAEEFMTKNPEITRDLCIEIGDHMGKLGIHLDYARPFEEQRPRMLEAFESGRNTFIGTGRLKSPDIVKANEKAAEAERNLANAKKRQNVRNPSAGGGAVSSKGKGKERQSMRGMSRAEVAKLYMEAQK